MDLMIALCGGLLIGLAAAAMLVGNGRIAGISGIVASAFDGPADDRRWRSTFLVGLALGGLVCFAVAPAAFGTGSPLSVPGLAVAGLLVGIGTRLGGGCTSGHGVCGIARFSPRSLVATGVFMLTAMVTVAVMR